MEAQDDLVQLRQARQAAKLWEEDDYGKVFLWYDERLRLVYAALDKLHPVLDELTLSFIRPEAKRLIEELEDIHTTHFRRAAIGDRLAEIGDSRPGTGLTEHR